MHGTLLGTLPSATCRVRVPVDAAGTKDLSQDCVDTREATWCVPNSVPVNCNPDRNYHFSVTQCAHTCWQKYPYNDYRCEAPEESGFSKAALLCDATAASVADCAVDDTAEDDEILAVCSGYAGPLATFGAAEWADYTLHASVQLPLHTSGVVGAAGVVLRAQDEGAFYLFRFSRCASTLTAQASRSDRADCHRAAARPHCWASSQRISPYCGPVACRSCSDSPALRATRSSWQPRPLLSWRQQPTPPKAKTAGSTSLRWQRGLV